MHSDHCASGLSVLHRFQTARPALGLVLLRARLERIDAAGAVPVARRPRHGHVAKRLLTRRPEAVLHPDVEVRDRSRLEVRKALERIDDSLSIGHRLYDYQPTAV